MEIADGVKKLAARVQMLGFRP